MSYIVTTLPPSLDIGGIFGIMQLWTQHQSCKVNVNLHSPEIGNLGFSQI